MAPENTLLAMRLAVEAGVDALETDVRLTADGQLVLAHDADLARTTDGAGAVQNATLAELRALDAGYWFTDGHGRYPFRDLGLRMPTLVELCELLDRIAPHVLVNIELKTETDSSTERVTAALADWLRATASAERVLLSSFDAAALARLRAICPAAPTALLVGQDVPLDDALAATLAGGHCALHPHHSAVTGASRAVLERARAAGVAVNVWTINDAARMRELAELGVDGIMSDDPQRLRATLDAWSGA
jgi:glycerophosphoryl diester phosphodiesterase